MSIARRAQMNLDPAHQPRTIVVLGSFQVNDAMNSMGREDLTYVL
jgi:hypothetical protein